MEASNIAMLRNIMKNISRLNDEWFDTFPTDEGQTGIHDALMYEVMEADKILSAPPRNCDKQFTSERVSADDVEQAWIVFKRCYPNVYFDVPGLLRFIVWLFSEAKGATDGSK